MNRKKLRRFETILWIIIRGILYLGIMAIYIALMGMDNIALRQLSRTLGISLSTMALSLAKYAAANRKALPRNVLFLFQPSEETTGGAERLCETGVLEQYHTARVLPGGRRQLCVETHGIDGKCGDR